MTNQVELSNELKAFNICPDLVKYPDFIVPAYGTPYSAALDVFAQEDLVITRETTMIDLGFRAEFHPDFACILLPRSGSGAKFGLALANTVGLIDSDYRGTWMAAAWLNGGGFKSQQITALKSRRVEIVSSNGNQISSQDVVEKISTLEISRGTALGQLLFVRTNRMTPNIVSELSETVRGAGGFGSTDK